MTRVAIQGIRGSYSEEAAIRLVGESIELIECSSFADAFKEAGSPSTLAVVPVSNSIVGRIEATSALLASSGLKVHGETVLEIDHVLAGTPNAEFTDVGMVRSHPEALRQCSNFFLRNPQIKTEPGRDTASSIREIVGSASNETAAIGSRRAAEMYGAKVLSELEADAADNRTTFYLIGK